MYDQEITNRDLNDSTDLLIKCQFDVHGFLFGYKPVYKYAPFISDSSSITRSCERDE